MSLDITVSEVKELRCPHCGEFILNKTVDSASSGGRVWYDFLEDIGYYVPYEQRTEENDRYGKDMVLTKEQAEKMFKYAKQKDVYDCDTVRGLIAGALLEGNKVVINANW